MNEYGKKVTKRHVNNKVTTIADCIYNVINIIIKKFH